MPNCTLGCTAQYTAYFISKDGVPLGSVQPFAVSFNRVLDNFSEAEISVSLAGDDCEPCPIVSQLRTWHYHLVLLRDGEYVWEGPVNNITWSRTQAVITAIDVLGFTEKRILHDTHCFAVACGGAAADLSDIATALLNDIFEVDTHRAEFYKYNDTGLLGERLYQPGEQGLNSIQEELRLGLDMTVIGTRIIYGAAPFGRIATLTSDDFLVDLEVEEDGDGAATRAITIGDGVVGVATAPGTDINGEDAYYGLLEYVSLDRSELNTQQQADDAAQAIVNGLFPPPRTITTPTGARLSPNAPVCIEDLVPGVACTVIATDVCVDASGDFILIEVQFDWDLETQEEQVSVTFANTASINDGEN